MCEIASGLQLLESLFGGPGRGTWEYWLIVGCETKNGGFVGDSYRSGVGVLVLSAAGAGEDVKVLLV